MTIEVYHYWELDFTKPNKDCNTCEIDEDYTCIACEGEQVREKYPNAHLNDECQWELTESEVA